MTFPTKSKKIYCLKGIYVLSDRKKESEVTQSCPTLCDPVDCSPPGSSIHGIFQARVLVAIPSPSDRGQSERLHTV